MPFAALPRKTGGVSQAGLERRERLMQAAFEVFGRQGYKETTLRMICAQARMTERYFYDYFKSLDEIFLAVRQRLSTELMDTVMQALARPAPQPAQAMRHALACFFEYIKSDPRRARILMLDALSFGLSSTDSAKTRLDWYAGLIEARLRSRYPTLPPHLDFRLVASGFIGQVTYVSIVWTLNQFDTPIEHLVDHAFFSWAGLHQWLADHEAGGTSPAT